VPAAAVIPAPEAYINVAAVETLVVGCIGKNVVVLNGSLVWQVFALTFWIKLLNQMVLVYLEKILLFKTGLKTM